MYADKYSLTREQSVFLAKKKWDENVFCGMKMESRNVTFPQTQTILHGVNVPGVALGDIATVLGYSPREINRIRIASMLHDLGKLMISNDILEKPGKLTPEEFAVVKTHTTQGEELLKRCTGKTLKLARTIAVEHHERWDGKGYPRGLKGEEISEASQITSVADVFDALSSKRCYKEAWDDDRAKAEIDACSGSQFSPAIVSAFDKAYPEIERSHASYQDDEV